MHIGLFYAIFFRVLIKIMSALSLDLVGNFSDGTYCWPLKIISNWIHIQGIGIIFVIQVGWYMVYQLQKAIASFTDTGEK